MKLPRDIAGQDLVRGFGRVGYEVARQKGDYVYMTTQVGGEHHVSMPLHKPVKTGTLAALLTAVAGHLRLDRAELLRRMKVL